jgi:hypothetical protein
MIAPRSKDGGMDQHRPMREQTLHGCIQVGHLKGKADLPADALFRFDLVDRLRLGFVKDLQGGMAHIEDQRPTLTVIPELHGFNSKSVTIEFYRAFVVAGGKCDTQSKDGIVGFWIKHNRFEPFSKKIQFLKPGVLSILTIFIPIIGQQFLLLQAPPKEDADDSHHSNQHAGTRAGENDPARDPQDEAEVHGVAKFGEHAGGYQVVDVFHSPQLDEGCHGNRQPQEQHTQAHSPDKVGKVDVPGVRRTHEDPTGQQEDHPREDNPENDLVFWIQPAGLFEQFITGADG